MISFKLSIQILCLGMIYTENHTISPLLYVITRKEKCYFTVSVKMEAMNSDGGERQIDRIRDATIRHGYILIGLTAADSFRQCLPSGVGTENDQNDFLREYRITTESQLWSFAYVQSGPKDVYTLYSSVSLE